MAEPDYCLLLIYRQRKDERLSWPSWLACSVWFTHISGHPSAASRAQDRESSPAKDRRSTTACATQPNVSGEMKRRVSTAKNSTVYYFMYSFNIVLLTIRRHFSILYITPTFKALQPGLWNVESEILPPAKCRPGRMPPLAPPNDEGLEASIRKIKDSVARVCGISEYRPVLSGNQLKTSWT